MALPFKLIPDTGPFAPRGRPERSAFRPWHGLRQGFALILACAHLLRPGSAAPAMPRPSGGDVPAQLGPWRIEGAQHDGGFGDVVAGVGDVNKDGFADVLIAAPRHDGQRGRVFIFHGSTNGLGRVPAWELRGEEPGDQLGYGAAAAGDVNGDGFADVLVATLGNRPGGMERNVTVAVYAGSPAGLRPNPLWTIRDGEDHYGCMVGSAGDVNGDGFADVFVSWLKPPPTATPHRGLLVFHGSPAGPSVVPDWRVADTGPDLKPSLGSSAAAAGDVNRDGYDDLLVGARDAAGEYPHGGKVLLFLGAASGLRVDPAWQVEFNQPRRLAMDPNAVMYFGSFLAGAGDVNGDEFPDVVVAAPYADHHDSDEGMVFVYHGSALGLSAKPNRVIEANSPRAILGYSVAGVGDVDGDGFADVLAGAPWATFDAHGEGAAALFRGGSTGIGRDPDWSRIGRAAEARLGKVVAGGGDVNGDGFAEVILNVPGHRSAVGTVGEVQVWYGSASGLANSHGWRMTKPWGRRVVEGFRDRATWAQWTLIFGVMVVAGAGMYFIGRLFERHRQQVIERERSAAREKERERIARNLHDDLGAQISALARGLRQSAAPDDQTAQETESVCAKARQMALSLDQAVWSLEPGQDTIENVVLFLGQSADQFLQATGIPCRRDVPLDLPDRSLSGLARLHLSQAFQEALHNIVKHARAREVWLRVRCGDTHLTVSVEDDGVGMPAETPPPHGSGLPNLQRRMAEVGGAVSWEPRDGGGTRVVFTMPLTPRNGGSGLRSSSPGG